MSGRRRRWRRRLVRGAAALAALLAAAVLLRRPLAAALLRVACERAGLPVSHLAVAELDLSHLEVADLAALGGVVAVARLRVDFSPGGLWHGRLDGIAIEEPSVRVTGREGPIDVRALLRRLPRDLEQAVALVRATGPVTVERARVELWLPGSAWGTFLATGGGRVGATGAHGLEVRLSAGVDSPLAGGHGALTASIGDGGQVAGTVEVERAWLRASGIALQGGTGRTRFRLSGDGRLDARGDLVLGATTLPYGDLALAGGGLAFALDDDRIDLVVSARAAGADLDLDVAASAHSLYAVPEIDLEVAAAAEGGSALACLGLGAASAGRARVGLRLGGAWPAAGPAPDWPALLAAIRPEIEVEAAGLEIDGLGSGVGLDLAVAAHPASGVIAAPLGRNLAVRVERPSASLLALGLRPPLLLTLDARATRLVAAPGPGGLSVSGSFEAALGEGPAAHRLAGRLEIVRAAGGAPSSFALRDIVAELRRPLVAGRPWRRIRVTGSLEAGDAPRAALEIEAQAEALALGPLSAEEATARAAVLLGRGPGGVHLATARPAVLSAARLLAAGGRPLVDRPPPIEVEADLFFPVSGWRGTLAARTGRLSAADLPVTAAGARLGVRRDVAGPWEATLDVEGLAASVRPARFAPASLSARIGPDGDGFAFTATVRAASRALLAGGGRVGSDGSGVATLDSGPLPLGEGQTDLGGLAPGLDLPAIDAGTARLSGEIAWGRGAPRTRGHVELSGLALRAGTLGVSGLDLDLTLDSLLPPHSPPGQRLTVGAVESAAGKVATDLAVDFQLEADPPRLRVDSARATVPGGRLLADGFVLDPAAESNLLPLRFESLELAELFRSLALEGLEGEGQVAGTLPVELAGGRLVIADARLHSLAPGIVRYRSERVRELLRGNNEWVDTVVETLRDFRYEVLHAAFDKSATDDVHLALTLRGHNPDVLAGHPMVLNIDLQAGLGSLLAALGESYRLQHDWLRRSIRSGR